MQSLNLANLCESNNQCSETETELHSRIITALSELRKPSSDLDFFVRDVMCLLHDFSSSTADLQGLLVHLKAGLTKKSVQSVQTRLRGERVRTTIGLKDSSGPVPDERDLIFVQQLREAHASILALQVQLGMHHNVEILTRVFLTKRGDDLRLFPVRQLHHEGQEDFCVRPNTGQSSLISPSNSIPCRQKSAVPPPDTLSLGMACKDNDSKSIDTQLPPGEARFGEACFDNPRFAQGLKAIWAEVEHLRRASNGNLEQYARLVKRFLHDNASDTLSWSWVYQSFSMHHRRDGAQERGETEMRQVMKEAAFKTLITPGWSATRNVLDFCDSQSKHLEEIGYVIFWLLWDWAEPRDIMVIEFVFDLSKLGFSFGPFGVPASAQERFEPSSVGVAYVDTCESSQFPPRSIQPTLLTQCPTDAESSSGIAVLPGSMATKSMHRSGPKASFAHREITNFMEGYRKLILADTAMTIPLNEDGLVVTIAQLYKAVLDEPCFGNCWDAATEPRERLEGNLGFAFRAEIRLRGVIHHFARSKYQEYMRSSVSIDQAAMAKIEHLLRILHELVYETVQLDVPLHENNRTASSSDQRAITGTSVGGSSFVTETTDSASRLTE